MWRLLLIFLRSRVDAWELMYDWSDLFKSKLKWKWIEVELIFFKIFLIKGGDKWKG